MSHLSYEWRKKCKRGCDVTIRGHVCALAWPRQCPKLQYRPINSTVPEPRVVVVARPSKGIARMSEGALRAAATGPKPLKSRQSTASKSAEAHAQPTPARPNRIALELIQSEIANGGGGSQAAAAAACELIEIGL